MTQPAGGHLIGTGTVCACGRRFRGAAFLTLRPLGATTKGVCRHSSIRATLRSALVDTSYVAHRGIELDMSASELSASASMRNDFSAFSYYRSQCVSASGITEDTPADAVELDGAEVIGYLGWGLIDIPSSSGDIEKRYGAVYVDYDAASGERLKRIPKKSFTWFKRAYESNGEDLG